MMPITAKHPTTGETIAGEEYVNIISEIKNELMQTIKKHKLDFGTAISVLNELRGDLMVNAYQNHP